MNGDKAAEMPPPSFSLKLTRLANRIIHFLELNDFIPGPSSVCSFNYSKSEMIICYKYRGNFTSLFR